LNLIRVMPAKGQGLPAFPETGARHTILREHFMQTSLFLARLIGPVLLIIAVGIFANEKAYRALGKEVLASYAFIYFFSVADLVGGIAIVLVHNVWIADWRILITLLGWMMVVRGAVRILVPDAVRKMGKKALANKSIFTVTAAVVVVIGAVLCFYGYRA
jgi:hypothetical protein